MARIKGREVAIGVKVNGQYKNIGLATSCALNIDADMDEKAMLSSLAKGYLRGRYGYTLDVERLFEGLDETDLAFTLLTYTLTGAVLEWRMTVSGGAVLSGECYVRGYRVNAPAVGHASMGVNMQGTGEIVYG